MTQRKSPSYATIGLSSDDLSHFVSHQWRLSRTKIPLRQHFLLSKDAKLHLNEHWCIAVRIEAVWASGGTIANDIRGLPHIG